MNWKLLFDRDAWIEVYSAIRKNKFRTLLTMIGVAWGMFLFVTLLGLTKGMQNGFDSTLSDTATNSLFIWLRRTSVPYEGYQRGRTLEFKMNDIQAIRENFPEITMIAPRNQMPGTIVSTGIKYNTFNVNGDFPELIKMFGKDIVQGRFINNDDITLNSKVCVIGEDIRKELYGNEIDVLGKSLRLGQVYYTIVGVYKVTDANFEGQDQIYIPFTTFQRVFNQGENVRYAAINIADNVDIIDFEIRLKTFLKKRKQIAPEDDQALGGFNLGEMFERLYTFMGGMQFLAIVVGSMTLFAGVIAISSILLITVSERTKEFGIRRALGAVPNQIRGQIILESVVLTVIAGFTGIVMATFVLYLINTVVVPNMQDNFPLINATVDVTTLMLSLLIMIIMAMLAGLIPAQRAIAIKPIDALRDE